MLQLVPMRYGIMCIPDTPMILEWLAAYGTWCKCLL